MRYEELLAEVHEFFQRDGFSWDKCRVDVRSMVDKCFELGGRQTDIRAFAKELGMEVIPNSQFAKKYPPFALRAKRDYYKVSPPEESRILHDEEEDKFYILIDDALSKGAQQEIIAYDIAALLLDYYPWERKFRGERKEEVDEFVARLLGYMKEEDDPETPDELDIEVVEDSGGSRV